MDPWPGTRIDVAGHALKQPQRGEVVLDRVSGAVQVEQRNQDIRKHVAGDENPAFLNQQRRMARGMRLMLDNPDLRAIPGNPRSFGGQAGNEAEQVQWYLVGDVWRYQLLGDAGLRTRVRQPIPDSSRAACRAVTGRRAEPGVPEQVIPMRMRREACHNGLARIGEVVREAGHFVALHSRVDEQHAGPAVHDNGVALAELALVDEHTLRDRPQHGWLLPLVLCNRLSRPYYPGALQPDRTRDPARRPRALPEFMDELRRSHLGSESPARSPSVRERL